MTEQSKPCIPEVIEEFRAYFRAPENGAWGSLHVVMDDGNLDDGAVRYCAEWAKQCGDAEGERLANVLLRMSRTQRGKLARLAVR